MIARLTKEFVYAGDPFTLDSRRKTWKMKFEIAKDAAKCTDVAVP